MLTTFSWQQFGLVTGTLLASYYLCILLLCFRRDVLDFLKKSLHRTDLPAPPPPSPQESLLGHVHPEKGPLLTEAESIRVAPPPTAPYAAAPFDLLTEEILRELRPLLTVALEAKAKKEELLPLVHLVTSRYGPTIEAAQREKIHRFLLTQTQDWLSPGLTAEELQPIWQEDPWENKPPTT